MVEPFRILDAHGQSISTQKALNAAMHARRLSPVWVRRPPQLTLLDIKVHLCGAARSLGLPLRTAMVDANTLALWVGEDLERRNPVRIAMDVPPGV